mmetsp:Transcript_18483/g.60498  ORF Transcript_18483/g.60498 Transcript_18483/m.60498 type:complete len:205 (-) Transcript_18483:127-741(-)
MSNTQPGRSCGPDARSMRQQRVEKDEVFHGVTGGRIPRGSRAPQGAAVRHRARLDKGRPRHLGECADAGVKVVKERRCAALIEHHDICFAAGDDRGLEPEARGRVEVVVIPDRDHLASRRTRPGVALRAQPCTARPRGCVQVPQPTAELSRRAARAELPPSVRASLCRVVDDEDLEALWRIVLRRNRVKHMGEERSALVRDHHD